MQHWKSHEDYSDDTACAQAQPCIAYPPENTTEDTILTPILLNLIPTERIPFSFREKDLSQNRLGCTNLNNISS